MKSFKLMKETINVDGKTFYHYEMGGKETSTEFVVFDGITYYNTTK